MPAATTISAHHLLGDDPAATIVAMIDAANAFATDEGLAPGAAARLAIVIEELVANVLRHGAPDRAVELSVMIADRDSALSLVFEDDGAAFDPRDRPAIEGPDPETGGGVGLALVKAWCEIVAYQRRDRRNRLELRLAKPA